MVYRLYTFQAKLLEVAKLLYAPRSVFNDVGRDQTTFNDNRTYRSVVINVPPSALIAILMAVCVAYQGGWLVDYMRVSS